MKILERIGRDAEARIAKSLGPIAKEHGGTVLTNLYIPCGSRIAEIDVLLLTRRGIFCLEVKDWGGQIAGSLRLNE